MIPIADRPPLHMLGAQFVAMEQALVDNPTVPVHMRWTYVLTNFAPARGRAVYSDFENDLQHVFTNGTIAEVFAAAELCRLGYFFYRVLMTRGIGRTHVNSYHIVNYEKWVMKLTDKLNSTKSSKIKRGKFLPEKSGQVVHPWMN